jgi:hypothetical protein
MSSIAYFDPTNFLGVPEIHNIQVMV